MNEEKMRVYAEYEALHAEFMALVPAAPTPIDPAAESPDVLLPSDEDVDRAIDLLHREQAKLQEYRDIPWQ